MCGVCVYIYMCKSQVNLFLLHEYKCVKGEHHLSYLHKILYELFKH